jgi:hypothetical protein
LQGIRKIDEEITIHRIAIMEFTWSKPSVRPIDVNAECTGYAGASRLNPRLSGSGPACGEPSVGIDACEDPEGVAGRESTSSPGGGLEMTGVARTLGRPG